MREKAQVEIERTTAVQTMEKQTKLLEVLSKSEKQSIQQVVCQVSDPYGIYLIEFRRNWRKSFP